MSCCTAARNDRKKVADAPLMLHVDACCNARGRGSNSSAQGRGTWDMMARTEKKKTNVLY